MMNDVMRRRLTTNILEQTQRSTMAAHDSNPTASDASVAPPVSTAMSAVEKQHIGGDLSESPSSSSDEASTLLQQHSEQISSKEWKRQILGQLQQLFKVVTWGTNDATAKRQKYQRWAGIALAVTASYVIHNRVRLLQSWLSSTSPQRSVSRSGGTRQSRKHRIWKYIYALLGQFVASTLTRLKRPDYASAREASLSLLQTAARNGVIQKALVGPSHIVFSTTNGWNKTTLPSNSPTLQSDLLDLLSRGGCTDIAALPESLASKLATPLLAALPFVYLALVYRMLKGLHNGRMDVGDFFLSKLLTSGRGGNNSANNSRTTFDDVAGLDDVLPEIREILYYLQNPSSYNSLGAEPPRGILLHGSPGTGKTLLARAVAGEANCDAFVSCSGSEFVEMYVGRGAARIRSLFQEARRVALSYHARKFGYEGGLLWKCMASLTSTPHTTRDQIEAVERPPTAIIFIDELDALAKARSCGMFSSNDERDQTLNQLLTEMDGFFDRTSSNKNDPQGLVTIIVIAATNRPEALDPAILRRFDRQIYVHLPNATGRKEILKIHAAKTNCRFSTIHWDHLSDQTHNFSGSDLKQVVNDAALLAVRQKSKRIEQGHFLQAIHRAKSTKVQQRLGNGAYGTTNSPLGGPGDEPPLLHPFLWFPGNDKTH
jgi:ATP-dependent Zn protease